MIFKELSIEELEKKFKELLNNKTDNELIEEVKKYSKRSKYE